MNGPTPVYLGQGFGVVLYVNPRHEWAIVRFQNGLLARVQMHFVVRGIDNLRRFATEIPIPVVAVRQS